MTLLMHKAYSQCRWVWDPWDSVTKDQWIAILNIPHFRNKFKQKHTSENLFKYDDILMSIPKQSVHVYCSKLTNIMKDFLIFSKILK